MVYVIPGDVYSLWGKMETLGTFHLPNVRAPAHWCDRKVEDSTSSKFKEMTEVIREWVHSFAKTLIYCMSWVSISKGGLLWDFSCCRETKGVNCYVSHYLKNFLAFLKGKRREISLPVLLTSSTHMNIFLCPWKKAVVRQDFLRIRLLDDHWRFPHQCCSCLAHCAQRALHAL